VASKGDTAWPRTPSRHILQLLVGFGAKSGCSDELALDVLEKAPREIDPDHTAADYLPSFVESYNDLSKVSFAEISYVASLMRTLLTRNLDLWRTLSETS